MAHNHQMYREKAIEHDQAELRTVAPNVAWPLHYWVLANPAPACQAVGQQEAPGLFPLGEGGAAPCGEGTLNWIVIEFPDQTNVFIGLDWPLLEWTEFSVSPAKWE